MYVRMYVCMYICMYYYYNSQEFPMALLNSFGFYIIHFPYTFIVSNKQTLINVNQCILTHIKLSGP